MVTCASVLCVRTLCILHEEDVCKHTLVHRANEFNDDLEVSVQNINYSPMFEIFKASIDLGLYKKVMGMISCELFSGKPKRKNSSVG